MEIIDLFLSFEISGVPAYQWCILAIILMIIGSSIYLGKNKLQRHSDKELYEQSKHYLSHIDEYHRKPLPFSMFSILIILVIAEAIGFSYVFAEYVLPDARGSEHTAAAYILALIISAVLVPLTHQTGANFYYNKLAKKINNILNLTKDYDIHKEIKDVDIENGTSIDSDYSNVSKMIHRIGADDDRKGIFLQKKWIVPAITVGFVFIIAISAYTVRESTYQSQMIEEMYSTETMGYEKPSSNVENKQADNEDTPAFLKDAVNTSEEIQHEGKILAKQKANNITYFMLSFLFLAIQCLGIFAGFNWGFAGKHSFQAYKNIKAYKK